MATGMPFAGWPGNPREEVLRAMQDVGLLLLRLTVGGLLAGHGGQKLFGWFSGPGLEGVGGMMEKLGLQPGQRWATIAGCGELGGGLCTALGFMHPVGPISMLAP